MTTIVRGTRTTTHVAYASRPDVDALLSLPRDCEATAHLPEHRQLESLGARTLLRWLLRSVDRALFALPIVTDPSGRPRLEGGPRDVGISLSHDNGHLAAAVSDASQVGVDVQQPLESPDDRLLRRCLNEHAARALLLEPEQRMRLQAEVWTVQEACVKAEGTGLSGSPWTIDVQPGDQQGRWRDYSWRALHHNFPVPAAVAWHDRNNDDGSTE